MRAWSLTLIPLAAFALPLAACEKEDRRAPDLALVDTQTGEIVERWPAPALTFDVAEDPLTGRVWAVAENDGDDTARVWELFPDRKELRYELHPGIDLGANGPFLGYAKYYWLDSGAIALDPSRRRGSFGSPGSDERALLDLDTGEPLLSVYSEYWGFPLGASFDTAAGIGYGTATGLFFAFATSSGDLSAQYCPQAWVKAPVFNPVDRKVYFLSSEASVSVFDPATGACGPQLPHLCGGLASRCDVTGTALSSDGSRLYVAAPSLDEDPHTEDGRLPSFSIWDLTAPDLADPTAQTEITHGAAPHGFAVSPDDSTLYVTMVRCNRIGVFDARTGEHQYDIPMDGETMGIDLSADGSLLYVSQISRNSVLSIGDGRVLRERAGPCPPIKERED